ncbi:hypothetical protein Tco_1069943 [Tanacetum coccineum]|uniref:Uncharacterized protein n=1 Tax=Tanacetum coccineum TaxID=301880 RepID=A0ABQ5HLF5_9ASTR
MPHIHAMVAGKRVLISKETIRADLLFDDADGVDCFPKQLLAAEERIAHSEMYYSSGSACFFSEGWLMVLFEIRNKDEGNLSEENNDQDDHNHTAFVYKDEDVFVAVTPDLERKSDETEQVTIEEEKDASDVKSGDTEELDLEEIQSTARQSAVTPRTLNFEDEAGPSSPIRPTQEEEPEEQFKDDEFLADISLNISRPRGLSIPGPMLSQPQQPTQATDPKEKGKGILVEEPKKKKLTLQQIRALETANDEEVARKVQAEWDAEEERKRLEDLKKPKPKSISKKPTSLAQERNHMMSFLKGQGYKNVQKLRYPQMKELYDKVQESIKDSFKDFIPIGSEREKQMLQERDAKRLLRKRKATVTEEQPSKKLKLRTETIDELRNYLRIVDFEKSAQDRESLEANLFDYRIQGQLTTDGRSISCFIEQITHFKCFRHSTVLAYSPTGLGLILLGDLTTIWETSATSDDDFWKNQEDWEIIRWRLNESLVCVQRFSESTPKIVVLCWGHHDRRGQLSGVVNIWKEELVSCNMQEPTTIVANYHLTGGRIRALALHAHSVVVLSNKSTICIVKILFCHSKNEKHIQIRHHFIRDCYEQRLINVVKVHTDDNVADLLTKGFNLALIPHVGIV